MALLKRGRGRGAAILLLLPGLLLAITALAPAQPGLSETEVKAAFLYNFTKFVDWPPAAFADRGSPIRLCIFGQDPFGRILDDLVRGETVDSRKLRVERPAQLQGLKSCHVLFVSRSEHARLDDILVSVRGGSVLTVGESDGFLAKGGLINFVREGSRVRFEISARPAEAETPKISSKLMRLAVKSPESQ